MNENYNQMYDDEKTINLVGLCVFILKKWKVIVIASVLVAIAAGSFTYMQSVQRSKTHGNGSGVKEEPAISENVKETVHIKLEMIEGYEQAIEEYEYYYANSIKVKMDSNNIQQGKMVCVASAENSADTLKAATLWENFLISEEQMQTLASMLSEPTNEAMLREVVEISTGYADDKTEIMAFGENKLHEAKLEVVVSHYNREDCETMLAFFENQIEDYKKMLQAQNVNVNIEPVSAGMMVSIDRTLANLRKDTLNAKSSAYEAILKIEKDMTAEQKAYYQYLNEVENAEENVQTAVPANPSINMKLAVLGGCAGGFFAAALYAVLYLFAGRVRGKEELQSWMNIPVMEAVSGVNMLVTEIAGIAAKHDSKRIFLTGSLEKQNTEMLLQMKAGLEKNGYECFVGNSILNDAKSLQEAAGCDGMVLLEKCNVSKEKDLREEILKASSCGINVLSIILEK